MFDNVLILGAGTMATGVAALLALKGSKVTIYLRSDEKIDTTKKTVSSLIHKTKRRLQKAQLNVCENPCIQFITKPCQVKSHFNLVFEAVSEDTNIKIEVQNEFNEFINEDTIWATNTSSLSVTKLASNYKYKSNFLGLHFFNPVASMELVEIIPAMSSSLQAVESIRVFCSELNKTSVLVNDSPGFIVNRLLIPMINEAVILLESGVASKVEIDLAMKLGAHHPMGPLALADLIGNDVCLSIMNSLYDATNDSKYRPSYLLKKMVYAGHLGRKTAIGFYDY
jgi:3-hydroxybutyryl-CoA dehydrogenase